MTYVPYIYGASGVTRRKCEWSVWLHKFQIVLFTPKSRDRNRFTTHLGPRIWGGFSCVASLNNKYSFIVNPNTFPKWKRTPLSFLSNVEWTHNIWYTLTHLIWWKSRDSSPLKRELSCKRMPFLSSYQTHSNWDISNVVRCKFSSRVTYSQHRNDICYGNPFKFHRRAC